MFVFLRHAGRRDSRALDIDCKVRHHCHAISDLTGKVDPYLSRDEDRHDGPRKLEMPNRIHYLHLGFGWYRGLIVRGPNRVLDVPVREELGFGFRIKVRVRVNVRVRVRARVRIMPVRENSALDVF